MTTVVISQPMYFPWPGFLAQLSLADIVVWLDDVQFSKGSFTNRVQVRMPSGMAWLSIPLERKGSGTQIADLVAAKPDWLEGHIATLRQSLKGTPHFDAALQTAEDLRQYDRLCDALIASSEGLAAACGLPPEKSFLNSELCISGSGSERVLKCVKALGGKRYITGHGAKNYLDHQAFEAEGIDVEYMKYDVKPWGPDRAGYSPFVTGLDLLANVGGSRASDHLNPGTVPWRTFLEQLVRE